MIRFPLFQIRDEIALDITSSGIGLPQWWYTAGLPVGCLLVILRLLAPVVILGGIYGGIFTPTEAAVVAVFYGLLIGLVVYRNLNFQVLFEVLRDSSLSTAVVMIVVAFAGLFSWTGSTLGVMDRAAQGLLKLSENPMERISRAAIPFVIALIAALLVITFIPSLSLWLPGLLGLR
jgi:TRAP-type C4-dicarboxylate transport system permease large subunit